MSKLSTTAWIAHNLGIATSIGGSLFGQGAFQPAIQHNVDDPQERGQISDEAWSRYSIWNLAAHGLVAATWFAGRSLLSGREVSGRARTMTRAKDALIIASLATGISTIVIGKLLGAKAKRQQQNTSQSAAKTRDNEAELAPLRAAVKATNTANIVTNAAIGALTTTLAMEGSKSLPFGFVSRMLP